MDNEKYEIIEKRKITKEEYDLIITILDKYKMNKDNFIINSKTLVLNKINTDEIIINGYNAPSNNIYYNNNSNLICELLHAASSTRSPYQGICIKPNKIYKKTVGYALNAGITDLFLELGKRKEGYHSFEKVCAKTIKYAYGIDIFNCYFMNDDISFRLFFNKYFDNFIACLDECSNKILFIKMNKLNGQIKEMLDTDIKVLMTITINELLKVTSDSGKNCKNYLLKQLKTKTMKSLYDIIGEYNYENYC